MHTDHKKWQKATDIVYSVIKNANIYTFIDSFKPVMYERVVI